MITAFASMEMAIDAIKKGAFYFVPKPFDNQQLLHILASGLHQRRLEDENRELRTALRDQGRFMELVGKSPKMLQVFQLISQVAPSRSTILVVGRERHRQGAGGEGHPPELPAARQALRGRQLREPPPRAARVEPLRPREGRLHRGGLREEGPLRAGRQGHALLRRDRQHPARDPGQAPARDAGARVHAPGRRRDDQGRRARGGRHQRRPAPRGRGGALPRGPLLPAERDRRSSCRRCASARRTSPPWSSTSSTSTRGRTASRSRASPPRRSRSSWTTTGRATCASSRT